VKTNRQNIKSVMNRMLRVKKQGLRQKREESFQELLNVWRKQTSKNEEKKVSPTSRSVVRSFSPQRLDEYRLELLEINKELEREEY